MAFIVITILVQAAIAFAVLHAFKVRKQKNITWTSPARKWYFMVSAAAQATLAVICQNRRQQLLAIDDHCVRTGCDQSLYTTNYQ